MIPNKVHSIDDNRQQVQVYLLLLSIFYFILVVSVHSTWRWWNYNVTKTPEWNEENLIHQHKWRRKLLEATFLVESRCRRDRFSQNAQPVWLHHEPTLATDWLTLRDEIRSYEISFVCTSADLNEWIVKSRKSSFLTNKKCLWKSHATALLQATRLTFSCVLSVLVDPEGLMCFLKNHSNCIVSIKKHSYWK